MATQGTVSINIVGDTSRLRSALGGAESDLSAFEQKMVAVGTRMKSIGRSMTMGVTLPIVAGLALATKAAADEQKEIATLDQALRNSTVITDAQRKATEKQITAWQNATGIADSQLRPALANLVIAGMSYAQSQKMMATAMDISVAKGIPLETVTKALARAYNGNTTSLSRLGIATKDAEGRALSFDEIMQNAAKTMGGSASAAADTAAGRMQILKVKFQDLVEQIGGVLIPIFERLVGWFSAIAARVQSMSPEMQKLSVGLLLVAAAIGPLLIMLGSLMTAITAISLPVLVIGGAIAGLIVVTALLYAKWDEVWSWMRDHPAIAAIIILLTSTISVPIILLVATLKFMEDKWDEVWSAIQFVVRNAWAVIEPILNFLDAILYAIADTTAAVYNTAKAAFEGFAAAAEWLWDKVKGPLGWLWDRLQDIVGIASKVKDALGSLPGLGGGLVPDFVPFAGKFADGGYVPGPIGAARMAVVHGGELIQNPRQQQQSMGGGGGGPQVIQLVVSGRVLAEVTASEFNRAGGPKIAQRAVV